MPSCKAFFLHFIAADLRTAFDLLDRNQDGRVTANELQFMLRNLGIHVRDELIVDLITEASPTGKKTVRIMYMCPYQYLVMPLLDGQYINQATACVISSVIALLIE